MNEALITNLCTQLIRVTRAATKNDMPVHWVTQVANLPDMSQWEIIVRKIPLQEALAA